MRFVLDGGLGDQMAATAIVREYHRIFPDDMIRVDGVIHPPIWENNPHLQHGPIENGLTCALGLHQYEGIGSIPHAFAKQVALILKRDFQIMNDTPELFLTLAEREEGERRLLELADPCRNCRTLGEVRIRHRLKIALLDSNAMWPSRRYPAPLFRDLVSLLRGRGWWTIQVGKTNPDSYGHVPEDVDCNVNFTDLGTIRGDCAMMHYADLFIGNDSGGFHLAAGVGCPQVALFGVKKWFARSYWNTTPVFPYLNCLPTCFDLCERTGGWRGDHCLSTVPAWRMAEAAEWAYLRYGRW